MRPEAVWAGVVVGAILSVLAGCSPSGGHAESSGAAADAGVTNAAVMDPGGTAGNAGVANAGGTESRSGTGSTNGALATRALARGAALFANNCTACHQENARGIPGVYPSLVGSPVVLGDPQTFVRWVVGGRRAPSMAAERYTTSMPQFGWMKAADAAALLTYLRSSFGNSAPPVDAAAVAGALEE
jgi:mono/diheme cytochrome c family protein